MLSSDSEEYDDFSAMDDDMGSVLGVDSPFSDGFSWETGNDSDESSDGSLGTSVGGSQDGSSPLPVDDWNWNFSTDPKPPNLAEFAEIPEVSQIFDVLAVPGAYQPASLIAGQKPIMAYCRTAYPGPTASTRNHRGVIRTRTRSSDFRIQTRTWSTRSSARILSRENS